MLGRRAAILAAWLVLIAQIGCSTAALKSNHGTEVYTKVGMWVNGGRHMTSNYKKGVFIPPNTKLIVHSSSENSIGVRIPGKRTELHIINRYEHTELRLEEIYDRYLSVTPIQIDDLREFEIGAIQEGRIVEGMTKRATLLTRGYPPVHRTPSIESDEWMYWQTPLDRIRVEFEENKVKRVID